MAKKVIRLTESDLIKVIKKIIREQEEAGTGVSTPDKKTTTNKSLPFINDQNKAIFLKYTNNTDTPILALQLVNKIANGKYNQTLEKIKSYGGETYDDNNQPKPGVNFMSQVNSAIKKGLEDAVNYGLDPNNPGSQGAFTNILNTGANDKSFTQTYDFLPIFTKIFNIQKEKVG